jgi:hypothetical protein
MSIRFGDGGGNFTIELYDVETRFRIQDVIHRIQDSGCNTQDSGFRMQYTGFKIQDVIWDVES